MKKLFLLAFAAAAFAACSDDVYNYELPSTYTVDFEGASAVSAADGFIWGKPLARTLTDDDPEALYFGAGSKYYFGPLYAQGDAAFYSFFTDYAGVGWNTDTWNGFAISSNTDMTTAGYANDTSVYATGGADGSKQFAIAYYGAWTGDPYGTPAIRFAGAVRPESVAIANTTYLYLYLQNDVEEIVDVKAVITGYNSGIETGKVEVLLADGASGKVKSGWEKIDLSSLGVVTELTFKTETADDMCPLYYAIDNLVYGK